jgi:putative sigma-54 modulation protein
MRIDFKFRHAPHSDELTNYVNERVDKLERFEMRPVRVEFTFSAEKEVRRVDIHVRGQDIEMHAHAETEDYFSGVDIALEKIARQLARKKAKIKDRKAPKVG